MPVSPATESARRPVPAAAGAPVVSSVNVSGSSAAPLLGEPVVLIAPLDGAGSVDATPVVSEAISAVPRTGKALAQGMASWYGPGFHGRRTANGERYDMHALTAAHKTLPFGTKVRVRSVHTGKEVVVRINDRGPYKHSRIIDLSLAAITALGLRHRGVTEVVLLRE